MSLTLPIVVRPLVCALLITGACGNDRAVKPIETQLVIGTGEAEFETLRSGDHLELHAGTQGGHHVWLSMRAQGLDPDGIRMVLEVIPTEPAPTAKSELLLDFTSIPGSADLGAEAGPTDEWVEFVGWPARVLAPECAAGQRVELRLSLEDRHGRTAHGSSAVIADPPKAGFQTACAL